MFCSQLSFLATKSIFHLRLCRSSVTQNVCMVKRWFQQITNYAITKLFLWNYFLLEIRLYYEIWMMFAITEIHFINSHSHALSRHYRRWFIVKLWTLMCNMVTKGPGINKETKIPNNLSYGLVQCSKYVCNNANWLWFMNHIETILKLVYKLPRYRRVINRPLILSLHHPGNQWSVLYMQLLLLWLL